MLKRFCTGHFGASRIGCFRSSYTAETGKLTTQSRFTTLRRRLPRLHFTRFLVVAALVATVACGGIVRAGQAGGGGLLVRTEPIQGVEVEYLGFTAMGVGNMSGGQIQFSMKRDGRIVFISHLKVNCMLFLAPNTVIVGGTVVNDTSPEFIGTTAVFVVRDNGEGKYAPADERSTGIYSLDLGFHIDCEEAALIIMEEGPAFLEEILMPIKTGNFRIAP